MTPFLCDLIQKPKSTTLNRFVKASDLVALFSILTMSPRSSCLRLTLRNLRIIPQPSWSSIRHASSTPEPAKPKSTQSKEIVRNPDAPRSADKAHHEQNRPLTGVGKLLSNVHTTGGQVFSDRGAYVPARILGLGQVGDG
jgi:hypothetical protein